MFVGPTLSYAAKRRAPHACRWGMFNRPQCRWLRRVWSLLVLLGLESASAGFTEAERLRALLLPYTHSLCRRACRLFARARRDRRRPLLPALLASRCHGHSLPVFSHLGVRPDRHTPNLPLYDDNSKVASGAPGRQCPWLPARAWIIADHGRLACARSGHLRRRPRVAASNGLRRAA